MHNLNINAICHLNGTGNPRTNAFNYTSSFTFSDDFQKQRVLETKLPAFRIYKLNNFHFGAFAWITNSQRALNATSEVKLVCWDRMKECRKR